MKKVLTVDDSKVVRTLVARYLEGYGCEVLEATNGQEGVDLAAQHRPDLILLDLRMPVMDGRQALAALRANPATSAIPVVVLTAEGDGVTELAPLALQGSLIKPFQKETFDKAVRKVLGTPSAVRPAAPAPAPAA